MCEIQLILLFYYEDLYRYNTSVYCIHMLSRRIQLVFLSATAFLFAENRTTPY